MLFAIVAVIALIIDQAVKYWTTVNIVVDTGEAKLIPGLIHFANVHNTGAAFSFLEGARWLFVILCLIFVLVVIYALAKDMITHPVCRWAALFVMAGALGNCIDRIVCGYVVDMLEFDFLIFKHPFPVFNVADIYITLGVIIFCICLLLEKPAKPIVSGAEQSKAIEDTPNKAEQKPKREARPIRKSQSTKRQKTEFPIFPQHAMQDIPVIDPNDPFAEWEKKASAPKAEGTTTVYTQPAAAEPVTPEVQFIAEPAKPAAPVEPAAPEVSAKPVVQDKPAFPAEAPETSKETSAASAPKEDEFDLESILAEFKDL